MVKGMPWKLLSAETIRFFILRMWMEQASPPSPERGDPSLADTWARNEREMSEKISKWARNKHEVSRRISIKWARNWVSTPSPERVKQSHRNVSMAREWNEHGKKHLERSKRMKWVWPRRSRAWLLSRYNFPIGIRVILATICWGSSKPLHIMKGGKKLINAGK